MDSRDFNRALAEVWSTPPHETWGSPRALRDELAAARSELLLVAQTLDPTSPTSSRLVGGASPLPADVSEALGVQQAFSVSDATVRTHHPAFSASPPRAYGSARPGPAGQLAGVADTLAAAVQMIADHTEQTPGAAAGAVSYPAAASIARLAAGAATNAERLRGSADEVAAAGGPAVLLQRAAEATGDALSLWLSEFDKVGREASLAVAREAASREQGAAQQRAAAQQAAELRSTNERL